MTTLPLRYPQVHKHHKRCQGWPSGLARSYPDHSGDGAEHRNASRPEPTRRHLNGNFGLHRRKADEEQGRLSTNVLSPHLRALHQEINNCERSPPQSHEVSYPIQPQRSGATSSYRSRRQISAAIRLLHVLCITCATSAGGFAFVGACHRTEGCLGIKPLLPSSLGAPFGTGVKLQWINCSWPLAHSACGPPRQMVWAAVLKGAPACMLRLDAPTACMAPVRR